MPPRTRRSVPRGVPAAAGAADRAGAASAGPSGAAAAEAPTPRLEVVLELQSATTASGSAAEAPAAAAAAPAAGARTFTLKPRVVRRADDERKALAEQEEKKFHDKAAEDARRRRASRVRGGRGRGRGDFAGGRDGLVRRIAGAADGPFSQAPLGRGVSGRSRCLHNDDFANHRLYSITARRTVGWDERRRRRTCWRARWLDRWRTRLRGRSQSRRRVSVRVWRWRRAGGAAEYGDVQQPHQRGARLRQRRGHSCGGRCGRLGRLRRRQQQQQRTGRGSGTNSISSVTVGQKATAAAHGHPPRGAP